ncbi:hypothetical protein [Ketobacter sp.]|nr:hypothetical protein [Ketobacter sp.]
MNNKKWMVLLLLATSVALGGCTTCDLALWLGNDVCEIGGL